jgi:hypothetical protein
LRTQKASVHRSNNCFVENSLNADVKKLYANIDAKYAETLQHLLKLNQSKKTEVVVRR